MENILYIHHVLTGTPLPYIKREIEDKMVRLFKQVDRVFGLVRSKVPFARTGVLNYYFVLFKLLDSLHQPDLLYRIPLLKTSIRLKQHDALWGHICEELAVQANQALAIRTFVVIPPSVPKRPVGSGPSVLCSFLEVKMSHAVGI